MGSVGGDDHSVEASLDVVCGGPEVFDLVKRCEEFLVIAHATSDINWNDGLRAFVDKCG